MQAKEAWSESVISNPSDFRFSEKNIKEQHPDKTPGAIFLSKRRNTMKTWTVFLFLVFFALPCHAEEDAWNADAWGRNRFEMMKIQQRAERGFTNRGRVMYKYVDDSSLAKEDPQNIGAIVLDRNSRVREVHVGIDIDKSLHFDKKGKSDTLRIGTVDAYGSRNLEKVNIHVDLEQPVKF